MKATVFSFLAEPRTMEACPGGGEGDFLIGPVGEVPTFGVSIFSKKSRTGYKIWAKIPEQASQKPMTFQNRSNLS